MHNQKKEELQKYDPCPTTRNDQSQTAGSTTDL